MARRDGGYSVVGGLADGIVRGYEIKLTGRAVGKEMSRILQEQRREEQRQAQRDAQRQREAQRREARAQRRMPKVSATGPNRGSAEADNWKETCERGMFGTARRGLEMYNSAMAKDPDIDSPDF